MAAGGDRRRAVGARGTLAVWGVLVGVSGGACEVESAPPPLREVQAEVDDAGATLGTTTISRGDELDGVERVRGHLVIASDGPVRLDDVVVIEGDLRVVGQELRPIAANVVMPELARIGGNVELMWTSGVARLSAAKLEEVGGHVTARAGEWALELPAVKAINGDLRLEDGRLAAVALAGLERIGGSLRLEGVTTPGLVAVVLERLAEIGGDLGVRGSELVLDAPRCLAVGGEVTIDDGRVGLGLAALREVRGDLRIEGAEVTTLELGSLRAVGDDLVLAALSGEASEVIALDALGAVGGDVRVEACAAVREVLLVAVQAIDGALVARGNPELARVEAVSLETLGGDLRVEGGAAVKVVLDRLGGLGGDLVLADNLSLEASLPRLAAVGGAVRLMDQAMATSGLAALAQVGGDLVLDGIEGTSEFDELRFEALRTVGGSLRLSGTRSVEKLSLGSLLSVGGEASGDLVVRDNRDLIGLIWNKLGAVAGAIEVRDNPLLPVEEIERELADIDSTGEPLVCGNLGGEPCP